MPFLKSLSHDLCFSRFANALLFFREMGTFFTRIQKSDFVFSPDL